MSARAVYEDVAAAAATARAARDRAARAAGIDPARIILDPGLGFAKRAEHTFAALAGLPHLQVIGRPILSGPSRKSFLKLGADQPPSERRWATAAAVTASILLGAHIVRVHDVPEMVQVARTADAILGSGPRAQSPEP
jgi:dihydropteroate synthase